MKLHRAWAVAAVTMLTLIAASAFRSTTSVLYMPIEMEFGWTRSLTSGAVALNILVYGFTAPFAAVIMARLGAKRVALVALSLIAAGTLLTTVMHSSWELYADWGILVGLGTGALALVFGGRASDAEEQAGAPRVTPVAAEHPAGCQQVIHHRRDAEAEGRRQAHPTQARQQQVEAADVHHRRQAGGRGIPEPASPHAPASRGRQGPSS